jgi:5-methyltetrahydropteroyltriglutamate--homocysteine methyltransferase
VKRSEARILTTHAGSLPRSAELVKLHGAAARGEPNDVAAVARAVDAATERSIEQQLACGIDVGNDGEQSRESFFTYVRTRMSGFGGASRRLPMRDMVAFPGFLELMAPHFARASVSLAMTPQAIGPIRYVDRAPLDADLARFAKLTEGRFADTFWTAPSPGIIACAMGNAHYATLFDYVDALAEALRTEYEAAAAAGHVLQIDAPDLAMERHTLFADRPLEEFLGFVRHVIAALNRALANVPRERVRLHVCWGNYEGPHTHDVPFDDLAEALYAAHVGGLVLSMANPRHAHEHRVLVSRPLPASWALIAGVIDTTTNYVEHPEVVADRLERAARAVGDPRRVLAGTDCGFDSSAGLGQVADSVVWEKLRALRDGAALATKRLF